MMIRLNGLFISYKEIYNGQKRCGLLAKRTSEKFGMHHLNI